MLPRQLVPPAHTLEPRPHTTPAHHARTPRPHTTPAHHARMNYLIAQVPGVNRPLFGKMRGFYWSGQLACT
jgi:hypothetical protein